MVPTHLALNLLIPDTLSPKLVIQPVVCWHYYTHLKKCLINSTWNLVLYYF